MSKSSSSLLQVRAKSDYSIWHCHGFVEAGKYSTVRNGKEIGGRTLSKDLIEFYQIQFQTTAQTQLSSHFIIANGWMNSLTPSILLRPCRWRKVNRASSNSPVTCCCRRCACAPLKVNAISYINWGFSKCKPQSKQVALHCYTCVYRTMKTAWRHCTSKSLLNHKLNMM